jgi:hypothetical protein
MTHKDLTLSIGTKLEKTSANRDIIHNSMEKGKQKLCANRRENSGLGRLEMEGVPQVLDFPVII